MYTVFIWDGIYRIKLFWQLSNERLTALESPINMSPVEVLVKTGCSAMENSDRKTLNPKE